MFGVREEVPVSVCRCGSLLALMLMAPSVALGGSVSGTDALSGAEHMESGAVTRTPLPDEGQRQEPADEMQKMTMLRPDWQRIVGKTGSATVFRRWLAKQPKAYQRMIESASTAAELNESIEEFLASDDARVAAHREELDVKLAEMRARAQGQGRQGDEGQRLE